MAKATTLHLDAEAVIDLAGLIIAARTDAQFEYAELSGSYAEASDGTAGALLDILHEKERYINRMGELLEQLILPFIN